MEICKCFKLKNENSGKYLALTLAYVNNPTGLLTRPSSGDNWDTSTSFIPETCSFHDNTLNIIKVNIPRDCVRITQNDLDNNLEFDSETPKRAFYITAYPTCNGLFRFVGKNIVHCVTGKYLAENWRGQVDLALKESVRDKKTLNWISI